MYKGWNEVDTIVNSDVPTRPSGFKYRYCKSGLSPSNTYINSTPSLPLIGDTTKPVKTLYLGPPGTGKTTKLLKTLEKELRAKVSHERIAFVTFTRAAAQEARARALAVLENALGQAPDYLPWFKTVHAAALKLLGANCKVMDRRKWTAFAQRYDYDLSHLRQNVDDPYAPPTRTHDDRVRAALDWCRARLIPITRYNVQRVHVELEPSEVEQFRDRLEAFKRKHGLIDFADMLEQTSTAGLPVDVAIIDEAQDLCPAEILCVESWFAHCERVYIAGDDDQAVYSFRGAEPAWLLSLNNECDHVEVLSQSYRVPRAVHEVAGAIIKRNYNRVPKAYAARDAAGDVRKLWDYEVLEHLESVSNAFLLARNHKFLKDWAGMLRQSVVPFASITGWLSPLDNQSLVKAVRSLARLRNGQTISAAEWANVLHFVSGLPRGRKMQAKRDPSPIRLERGELHAIGVGPCASSYFTDLLQQSPVKPLNYHVGAGSLEYLERLWQAHENIPNPVLRLGTWHSAKGLEADTVFVLSDMAWPSYEEYTRTNPEAENRLAYVAVTRARERLVLVEPQTSRAYQWP